MRSNPRAVAKLLAVRSGHAEDTPSARNPFELFAGAIVGVLIMVPPLILVTLSVAGVASVRLVPSVLLSLACAAVIVPLAWRYYRDETSTPFNAVRYFMLAALTGHSRHAYEMLAEADKDTTPRTTGDGSFTFDSIEGFRAYWDSIRDKGGGIGRVVIRRGHEVTMLDDDLALVKFSFASEEGVHRKLAVRVSNEWHLFNGEWTSSEEEDTSWTAEAGPHSPALQTVVAPA